MERVPRSAWIGNRSSVANWIGSIAQGQLVIILGVLAIAGVGLSMLSGGMELRRGMAAVVGCFILFGASAIARGLPLALVVTIGTPR